MSENPSCHLIFNYMICSCIAVVFADIGRYPHGSVLYTWNNRKARAVSVPTSSSLTRNSCDRLIQMYNAGDRQFGTCVHRNTNPDPGSIAGYCYKSVEFNGGRVSIPTVSHAILDPTTCPRATRTNFGNANWVTEQMAAMNRRYYGVRNPRNDEKGHLIASQVCGPADWYNLAPQTQQLNANRRRVGNARIGWYDMERDWAQRVQSNGDRITVHIFLDYEHGRGTEPNRPSGFRVCTQSTTATDLESDLYFANESLLLMTT